MRSLRMCLSAGEALPPQLYERWRGLGLVRDPRRHRLGRALPHLHLQPPGRREARLARQARARLRGAYRGRRRSDAARRRGRPPVGQGRLGRALLLRRSGEVEGHLRGTATGSSPRISSAATCDGYYFYSGRGDDILKVRGMFVSPLEIEDCLASHPAIARVRGGRGPRRGADDRAQGGRGAARRARGRRGDGHRRSRSTPSRASRATSSRAS
jgi:hypothetical protein